VEGRLLEWAKSITLSYSSVEIVDLSSSWRDGLAFCAVVHHYHPDEIENFETLDNQDRIGNLNLAFGILEKLGIKATLVPEDVAETPDKRAIRNYLVTVHNKLSGKSLDLRETRDNRHNRDKVSRLQIPTPSTPSRLQAPSPAPSTPENLTGKFSLKMIIPQSKTVQPDFTYKVILLGDSGVGKSALFERWKTDVFVPTTTTVGIEVFSRLYACDGKVIQIQVWDTAGQEVYRAITKSYYREVKGALIVYDITRADTFHNIQSWAKELFATIPDDFKIPVLIIGNKKDLDSVRTISVEEAQELAERNSFQYIETSAKHGNECQKSFQLLFQHIYKVHQNQLPTTNSNNINLDLDHNSNEPLPDPPVSKNCMCSL